LEDGSEFKYQVNRPINKTDFVRPKYNPLWLKHAPPGLALNV